MKKALLYIILCLAVLITSCVDDRFDIKSSLGEGETIATLNFGHKSFDEVEINSRATLSAATESRIENLFVYIFDSNGKRVYAQYFDQASKAGQSTANPDEYWTVNNYTEKNKTATNGEVHMKVPVLTGGSIYVVANLNADMMNISPEALFMIDNLDDLKRLDVSLSQEITSRTGNFLMSGIATNINIAESGDITQYGSNVVVDLSRLDAKVSVKIALGTDPTKIPQGITLKRFIPESWQVMRMPKACNLIECGDNADEMGFFDSDELFFESSDATGFGFSFYVMENNKSASGLTSYHQRDERHKNADGTYDLTKGMWKHIDDNATYMVIKGRLQITEQVDPDNIFSMQYLEADVVYYIHLGNFGSSNDTKSEKFNNFSANRNTHYNYNISIYGVDNIIIEVVEDRENQSGATGNVYKSREEILTYDAHYGQRVYRVDAEDINDTTLTWYAKTAFCEGRPGLEFGTENPNLDYKWAWFKVNKIGNNNMYSENNQWYPGNQYQSINELDNDDLWNVNEFVEWLRAEKVKFRTAPDSEKNSASAFRLDKYGRYSIYATIFVDENYYEFHPLTGEQNTELWKQFVNKPHRIMHILCESQHSKDQESSLTNSIITLRQRSIQTVYNTNKADVHTAWGCETVDEFINSQLFYFSTDESTDWAGNETNLRKEYFPYKNYSKELGVLGQPSKFNGLYNSIKMWGISPNSTRWDTYFDYNRPNNYTSTLTSTETHFLVDDKKKTTLRYSSLMRNRDNDGDKIIDEDEIRWYVATLDQLYDLYIGQLGIDKEAYLYPNEMITRDDETFPLRDNYSGVEKWRNHIIASTWIDFDHRSTANGGAYYAEADEYADPQVLWSEEGLSISYYRRTDWTPTAPLSTRSVRNLGITTPEMYKNDNQAEEGVGYPQRLIIATEKADGNYEFDLTNMNPKSIRFFTSHELEVGNENSETSKIYYGFETGPVFYRASAGSADNNKDNYLKLKQDLDNGIDVGCPSGYRVPNVREGAIMALYCSEAWWDKIPYNGSSYNETMVSTYFSLGNPEIGGYGYADYSYSWMFGKRSATLGKSNVRNIIPVRDIRK